MTDTPTYENVSNYLHPLLKSSERIGSTRALLILSKWLEDEINAKRIKPSVDVKKIEQAIIKIREDILLQRPN